MTDRPLLFSAPMVRALLDGRKGQTRRLAKFVQPLPSGFWHCFNKEGGMMQMDEQQVRQWGGGYAPYAVGDRIWVKETWRTFKDFDAIKPTDLKQYGAPIFYELDRDNCDRHGKIRVSIHMPRWASRLTLIVTGVRVERLLDISHADAVAEGINCYPFYPSADHPLCDGYTHIYPDDKKSILHPDAKRAYFGLWDEINGDGASLSNPWVVALTFNVERRNIDQ